MVPSAGPSLRGQLPKVTGMCRGLRMEPQVVQRRTPRKGFDDRTPASPNVHYITIIPRVVAYFGIQRHAGFLSSTVARPRCSGKAYAALARLSIGPWCGFLVIPGGGERPRECGVLGIRAQSAPASTLKLSSFMYLVHGGFQKLGAPFWESLQGPITRIIVY